MKPKFAFVLFIAIFTISGCKFPDSSSATATINTTQPPAPSATSEPSVTEAPTDTPSPTETLSPTDTAQPTATFTTLPTYIYANAEIFGVGWLGSGHLLITVETERKIEGEYYALVGDIEFNCRVSEDYENRLLCVGNEVSPGKGVEFTLIDQIEEKEVFETLIDIPPKPAPTKSSSGGSDPTQEPPPPPPTPNPDVNTTNPRCT